MTADPEVVVDATAPPIPGHNGLKPYICAHCVWPTNVQQNLPRHHRRLHPKCAETDPLSTCNLGSGTAELPRAAILNDPDYPLLDIEQAADALGLTPEAVHDWIVAGKVPAINVAEDVARPTPQDWRFRRSVVDTLLREGPPPTVAPPPETERADDAGPTTLRDLHVVHEFALARGGVMRAAVSTYHARPTVDLRVWFESEPGHWTPTKKGVRLPAATLPDLEAALAALREAQRVQLSDDIGG
jgi:hypothetical protein